jgi:hypothetical protein
MIEGDRRNDKSGEMQMLIRKRMLGIGLFVLGFALNAQAGPAMFEASFLFNAWGNDITSGTTYPYNVYGFNALPLGHDCQSAVRSTPNGGVNHRYCYPTTFLQGYPATGSGYLVTGGATLGVPIGLPISAFSVNVTGFQPTYYPYIQSQTYANFVNEAGTFFAGGGPAFGKGTHTFSGMGLTTGKWVIHEGNRGFGGAMGLLGFYGAKSVKFAVPGKAGTYVNTDSPWDMVTPLGREQYATPTRYNAQGKATNWLNPHTLTGALTNNVNGNMSSFIRSGIGTPWTTGTVTLYQLAGYWPTIFRRTGYDSITGGGARNIQLVTPGLVHAIAPGAQVHNGHIGVLNLRIVPEPGAALLLAAGAGVLALLYWASHRRSKNI